MTLKHLKVLFLFAVVAHSGFAQLTITSAKQTGNWADYYVQNVLLGTGVTAFNATFTGCDTTNPGNQIGFDSTQIAEFTSVNTAVEIPYGVMLCSGSTENKSGTAVNPNPGPTASDGTGDPDLAQLVGGNLNNAAILEFDFVPQGDTIRFNYTFASVEYPGFICSSFNDVFGFFLSGPGISGPFTNGAENLAVVPGTSTPVTINSINDSPGQGMCSPSCPCNAQYFVNNYTAPVDTNVLFGGLTVSMQAVAQVICGDTYHIKMAIADVADGALDSGVFLEGGSFTSNLIEVDISTVNGDSTINEGCGDADILFSRGDTTDTSITYLFFSGTATNGVDFSAIPDSIVLLPGVFDTTITISPIPDGLNEGFETFTISAVSVTLCGDTFVSTGMLYIYDLPNIVIDKTLDTTFTCPPDSVVLYANALSGGPPPFTYVWNNGMTGDTIVVQLSPNGGTDTFAVEVQDSCALTTIFDTIIVTKDYADDPIPEIINDTLVNCAGEVILLECLVDFGTPDFSYEWSNGDTTSTTSVTVNGTFEFYVTVTDDCGRSVVDTAFLGVKVPDELIVQFPDTSVFCIGSDLFVNPEFSGGIRPFNYSWDQVNPTFDDDSTITVTINQDTTLFFWTEDACGRQFNTTFFIDAVQVDSLSASLPSFDGRCGGEEYSLDPNVSGGLAPLTYSWSTGDSDTVIVFVGSVSQNVILTVTDYCMNQVEAVASINIAEYAPMNLIISGDAELCYGEEYIIRTRVEGGAGDYSFEWFTTQDPLLGEMYDNIDSNTFRVISRQSNTHYIRVTDFCGNTMQDTLRITIDPCVSIPNVITPNGDGLNDAFYIDNIINFDDAHLFVYNRWGQKVFESKPYRNEWVPNDQASGTYFYVLRSENFNELRGDLTIINDND
jgi:gliding motility-associated-like protein